MSNEIALLVTRISTLISASFAPLVVTLISALISVSFAFSWGDILHMEHPDLKPYKWGYFNGWMGVLIGGVTAIMECVKLWNTYDNYFPINHDIDVIMLVYSALVVISCIFIIKRNKWGWIVGIILQGNPILWIINGIYVNNRWSELSGLTLNTIGPSFNKKPLAVRALVIGSIFWIFVVLVFVFVFEPFRDYVIENGWTQYWWLVAKIIIFPPLVAVVGYFLYSKLVRPQKI